MYNVYVYILFDPETRPEEPPWGFHVVNSVAAFCPWFHCLSVLWSASNYSSPLRRRKREEAAALLSRPGSEVWVRETCPFYQLSLSPSLSEFGPAARKPGGKERRNKKKRKKELRKKVSRMKKMKNKKQHSSVSVQLDSLP